MQIEKKKIKIAGVGKQDSVEWFISNSILLQCFSCVSNTIIQSYNMIAKIVGPEKGVLITV